MIAKGSKFFQKPQDLFNFIDENGVFAIEVSNQIYAAIVNTQSLNTVYGQAQKKALIEIGFMNCSIYRLFIMDSASKIKSIQYLPSSDGDSHIVFAPIDDLLYKGFYSKKNEILDFFNFIESLVNDNTTRVCFDFFGIDQFEVKAYHVKKPENYVVSDEMTQAVNQYIKSNPSIVQFLKLYRQLTLPKDREWYTFEYFNFMSI